MRLHFGPTETVAVPVPVEKDFAALAVDLQLDYAIRPASRKTRVLVMVSKIGHCLNDLLFRASTGQLPIEIPLIVSNHPDFEPLATHWGVVFHHLPVTKETKQQQEHQVLDLVKQHDVELVVLARYMQVLSPTLCSAMAGRIINVHHAALPSFPGAKPYHQAFMMGVKVIGATAHFGTYTEAVGALRPCGFRGDTY